jgi:hypothetical protein
MLLAIAAIGLRAADPAYVGKWKLNPAKSDFGAITVVFEQLAGGEMKATVDGLSYNFKTDGKDYPTPWGTTSAWKAKDANTWETTDKVNGKVLGTGTVKLSADGKTQTVDSKMMKADGGSSNDSSVYERVSGGPGLAGKWKTKNVKMSAPGVVDIAAKGDGVVIKFVDEGGVCDARFDGKDYPATGPMWASGWTCVIAKNGANALDYTWKKDNKTLYKGTMTASADSKTLTDTGGAAATTEKTKIVYERY